MKYAIIPTNLISSSRKELAERTLAAGRKDLRLPMVKIMWFCDLATAKNHYKLENPETFEDRFSEPSAGLFYPSDPGTIRILAWQDNYQTQLTILHELCHVRQKLSDSLIEDKELFVDDYAKDAIVRLSKDFQDNCIYLDHVLGKDWSKDPSAASESKPVSDHKAAGAEVLKKYKSFKSQKADARADIALINEFAVKELKPDDVYCFSVNLCDNDVDRDNERFTDRTLQQLAKLFVGKTGIRDHLWNADQQIARIYRAEVDSGGGTTKVGTPLKYLRASAYIVRNETNQPIIDAIDAGIMKEVSVGCATRYCNCSICKKPLRMDWRTGKNQCENDHVKGQTYPEGLCVGDLEEAVDAYEFSFVAVPAQPGAGVTKGQQLHDGLTSQERRERQEIIQLVQKYR